MNINVRCLLLLFLSTFLFTCRAPDPTADVSVTSDLSNFPALRLAMKNVEPFFAPMGEPEQYDWLGSHREPGQTFDEYLSREPTRPTAERHMIYVLPLGKFTSEQLSIVNITARYLEAFYGLPVQLLPNRPLSRPTGKDDVRIILSTHSEQIRTGYIMEKILKPVLPSDAAALIAFTNVDLFPDSSMYFVFGQASMEERIGVWSLKRLGDKTDHRTFLLRTLKIAAHETGHMFSMLHCTKYECVMSGTNYLGETDRRPIDTCPECMAKVCWISGVPPGERYIKLADFCRLNGLTKESEEFRKKQNAVSGSD